MGATVPESLTGPAVDVGTFKRRLHGCANRLIGDDGTPALRKVLQPVARATSGRRQNLIAQLARMYTVVEEWRRSGGFGEGAGWLAELPGVIGYHAVDGSGCRLAGTWSRHAGTRGSRRGHPRRARAGTPCPISAGPGDVRAKSGSRGRTCPARPPRCASRRRCPSPASHAQMVPCCNLLAE